MGRQSSCTAQDLELLEALWRAEGANTALASALLSVLALASVGAVSVVTGRRLARRVSLRAA